MPPPSLNLPFFLACFTPPSVRSALPGGRSVWLFPWPSFLSRARTGDRLRDAEGLRVGAFLYATVVIY